MSRKRKTEQRTRIKNKREAKKNTNAPPGKTKKNNEATRKKNKEKQRETKTNR